MIFGDAGRREAREIHIIGVPIGIGGGKPGTAYGPRHAREAGLGEPLAKQLAQVPVEDPGDVVNGFAVSSAAMKNDSVDTVCLEPDGLIASATPKTLVMDMGTTDAAVCHVASRRSELHLVTGVRGERLRNLCVPPQSNARGRLTSL